MIYQNSSNAWVVLALIAMLLCGALGLVLGIGTFGPWQAQQVAQAATLGAIDAQATQGALFVVQTPQAAFANQTAVSAELTAVPMYQTATQVAVVASVGNARATATQYALDDSRQAQMAAGQATQTSMAQQAVLSSLAFNATATSMAQGPMVRALTDGGLVTFGWVAMLMTFLAVLIRLWTQATQAQTHKKVADAHLVLAEQRRLRASQTTQQAHYAHKDLTKPVPASLINKSGNGRDLPRAE